MPEVSLPNGWRPRPYQRRLWSYLERGGTRALEVAHRRWGKDDVALHWAACASMQRPGVYWHMLPMANQSRKAIWEAVNPHTGKLRIDEAFPQAIRTGTRNTDMRLALASGSAWQVVGSDNFNALVGSPPVGVVFSEWALADPKAWAYLRPILAENGGWAVFITTPRGRNHAARMYDAAEHDPAWFVERQTALDTGVFTQETLDQERAEYVRDYGEEEGDALFRQEYMVSFDAPILGAYYGRIIERLEQAGRITDVPVEPLLPVHTSWDLGVGDSTAIWCFQVSGGEIRIVDCIESHGVGLDWYAEKLNERGYHGVDWVPHDARVRELGAPGARTRVETLQMLGRKPQIVPNQKIEDGINALRRTLPRCWFDKKKTGGTGLEALRNYRRAYDEDRKVFADHPLHDWASHYADAARYLAVAWQEMSGQSAGAPAPPRGIEAARFDEIGRLAPAMEDYL